MKPGRPAASATVGTSGAAGLRTAPEKAMARSRPSRASGRQVEGFSNIASTWPPSSAGMASPEPRKGTCTSGALLREERSSSAMWLIEALPAEAMLSPPRCRAAARKPAMSRSGEAAGTTRNSPLRTSRVMAVKSSSVS
jgi:hypothetical protein